MSTTLPAASVGTAHLRSHQIPASLPLWPRNVAIGLLTAYRAVISPLYGDVCRYYPSCSAYGVGAVQQHGAVKGSALALARILRCHPWAAGGVDDVPPHKNFRYALTPRGFVVPSPSERTDS
ncbi:membrane protein insertion efficiency factor YidD [Microbacterium gorillae]|uniref:membrane protein insertion efficiency factor YidD n=1 Tax=Microbacterium gorillae TaxID=1231063 RepID=UPI000693D4A3|nr:membrane protein insertion efficiency factor YidD [Microbacterium gorillae]